MTNQKTYQVSCTIKQGAYEYGDSLVIESDGTDTQEQGFRQLAACYATDTEEEQEIIDSLKTEGIAFVGERVITKVTVHEVIPVTVTVRGGVIQDIQNIPAGLTIQVVDYDVDGCTADELAHLDQDEEGNYCVISVWENAESGPKGEDRYN